VCGMDKGKKREKERGQVAGQREDEAQWHSEFEWHDKRRDQDVSSTREALQCCHRYAHYSIDFETVGQWKGNI